MKDLVKLLLVFLCGTIGAALPLTGFYLFWSWCIAQVPFGFVWTGLVKIGITVGLIFVGGGATVACAILGGLLAGALAVALLE